MTLDFNSNEYHVLLNALTLLAEDLPEDDEDQPVIKDLMARIQGEA